MRLRSDGSINHRIAVKIKGSFLPKGKIVLFGMNRLLSFYPLPTSSNRIARVSSPSLPLSLLGPRHLVRRRRRKGVLWRRRKYWEERRLPDPYKLESQVELLISFCAEMGLSSVVFVGHDDSGLLALKATERIQASPDSSKVEVKGVVLTVSSLSREVVPGFSQFLLHMPLGKKHMVCPLLCTEITQVNHCAWYNSTNLTTEILSLYKNSKSIRTKSMYEHRYRPKIRLLGWHIEGCNVDNCQ